MSMTVKDLKEIIADLDDDLAVFIDGDHHGTSRLSGYGVSWLTGEDEYEFGGVDEEDITDDPEEAEEDWDKYLRSELTPGLILYGVG